MPQPKPKASTPSFRYDFTALGNFATHTQMDSSFANESSLHEWRINMTLGGECLWRGVEEDFWLAPGDIIITRPRTWMAVRVGASKPDGRGDPKRPPQAWDTVYVVFHPRPHWLVWLETPQYRQGAAVVQLDGNARRDMEAALLHVAHINASKTLLREERTMHALEDALLKLHEHVGLLHLSLDTRVSDGIDFIHNHFARPLSISDIARAAGLSVSRLTSLFGAAVGASPAQYLERIRLTRAAEMLRFSAEDITQIASSVGYEDPSYFARRFRLQFNRTPREYRAVNRPGRQES